MIFTSLLLVVEFLRIFKPGVYRVVLLDVSSIILH